MKRFVGAFALIALAAAVACGRAAPVEGPPEPPTLDVTSWTPRTELFMEHPPLVAGKHVRFAVHLTRLSDFSAVMSGRPRIDLIAESGGVTTTLPGTDPLRPGAFRVEGKLPSPGRYRWTLILDGPYVSDRHDLGTTTIFADEAAANVDAERSGGGDGATIAYLKEQHGRTRSPRPS